MPEVISQRILPLADSIDPRYWNRSVRGRFSYWSWYWLLREPYSVVGNGIMSNIMYQSRILKRGWQYGFDGINGRLRNREIVKATLVTWNAISLFLSASIFNLLTKITRIILDIGASAFPDLFTKFFSSFMTNWHSCCNLHWLTCPVW